MPGAAAKAALVSSSVTAITRAGSSRENAICLKVFSFIAALLVDMDFGHEPTEVLGVVRQVVELWGVQVVSSHRYVGGIEKHIQGLATSQRDRVRGVVEVVASFVTQQARIERDDLHGNAK